MTRRARRGISPACVLVGMAASWWSWGPARVTLENDALVVAYPLVAVAGWLGATLAFAAAAAHVTGSRRVLAAGLAALAALIVVDRASYRVAADADGVRVSTWGSTASATWPTIGRVETTASTIRVHAGGRGAATIDLSRLRPIDRASLERTISRRIREASRS